MKKYKITIDFETRSEADIKKIGGWKYSKDPSTHVLCMAYDIEDTETKISSVHMWAPPKILMRYMFNAQATHKGLMGHFNQVRGTERTNSRRRLRVLVCGGRTFSDTSKLHEVLYRLDDSIGIGRVIHGGAKGADSCAASWAHETGCDEVEYKPDWDVYGKSAGFRRNEEMLDDSDPDIVIVMDGGRGTDHMARYAQEKGVQVLDFRNIKGAGTPLQRPYQVPVSRTIKRGFRWDGSLVKSEWTKLKLQSRPAPLLNVLDKTDSYIIEAHNVFFEKSIWFNVCQPKHNFPEIPHENWECSAALAASYGLPRSLDKLGKALDLPVVKDQEGKLVMQQMTKRINGEFYNDTHRYNVLFDYCTGDVLAEKEIPKYLEVMPAEEHAMWLLDQKINLRGVNIDINVVDGAINVIEGYTEYLENRMNELTDGRLDNIRQRDKLVLWLEENGVLTESVDKQNVERILSGNVSNKVREVLEIRQRLGQTSTAKYYKMKNQYDPDDGTIKDQLMYHGAHTGRWSGRGAQIQNLPRGSLKPHEGMFRAIESGDWGRVQKYGEPMDVLASCIRGAIRAPEGFKLYVSDFSNVEGRVLAWLANEQWKVDAFEDFDKGVGHDIYKLAYAKAINDDPENVDDDGRQYGKALELSLGYQGWLGAFHSMAKVYGVHISDEKAKPLIIAWRDRHPNIVQFWSDLESSAIKTVLTGRRQEVNSKVAFYIKGDFLYMEMPSGRCLKYYKPLIQDKETPWGQRKKALTFLASRMGNIFRNSTYGGSLAENLTQAVARDLLRDALIRVEEEYPVIMHTHDEAVSLVPEDYFLTISDYDDIMSVNPEWAAGLPLVAEGFETIRYKKD